MFGRATRLLQGGGKLLQGIGELTGNEDLSEAGKHLGVAGEKMPAVREEAREALPSLGEHLGRAAGEGVFHWLDDAPVASKKG